jgi:hypothetical protein
MLHLSANRWTHCDGLFVLGWVVGGCGAAQLEALERLGVPQRAVAVLVEQAGSSPKALLEGSGHISHADREAIEGCADGAAESEAAAGTAGPRGRKRVSERMAERMALSLVLVLRLAGRRPDAFAKMGRPEAQTGLVEALVALAAAAAGRPVPGQTVGWDSSVVLMALRLLAALSLQAGADERLCGHMMACRCLRSVAPLRSSQDPEVRACVGAIASNLRAAVARQK